MSAPYRVKPDRQLIEGVLAEGGEDLKKCFQCATCSVVCELSDGPRPFPRKEMIWAQWGLKDRLAADPDIWLCHQCNDCSTKCPRGARPGDVLAALRSQLVQHYAVPRFLGKWVSQVKYLPVLILIPVVLLVIALFLRGPLESVGLWAKILKFMDHQGFYADLFPHWLLIGFFSSFLGLAVLAALVGVVRFWGAMKAADQNAGTFAPTGGIGSSILTILGSIFRHDRFTKCQAHTSRRWAHLGAFYGFLALFLVSVWAVIALYMINPFIESDLHYPFGFFNPWKLLANVGCIILIVGCVIAIRDRMKHKEEAGASASFDWIFVWLLLAVGSTGLLTEVMRYIAEPAQPAEGLKFIAYAIYFIHLVCAFGLLIYLPYSKFAHIVYRTVALVYAEHSGRNRKDAAQA